VLAVKKAAVLAAVAISARKHRPIVKQAVIKIAKGIVKGEVKPAAWRATRSPKEVAGVFLQVYSTPVYRICAMTHSYVRLSLSCLSHGLFVHVPTPDKICKIVYVHDVFVNICINI